MRIARAVVLVVFAACGGSQDTSNRNVNPDPVGFDDPGPTEPDRPAKDPTPTPPPKKMTLAERIAFHDGCFADFVAEKPDFFERCYTDSSTEEIVDAGEPPAEGIEAIGAATQPFWDAFALEGEIVLNVASGDNVVTVATVRLTNDGEFNGAPPTGKTAGLVMAEVQSLDDKGRHGAVRSYVDFATFGAQLGAAPKGAKFRPATALTGNPPVTVIATGSETEAANLETVRAGFEQFNKRDWKTLASLYTADAVISQQNTAADQKGSKAIDKMFKELGKAFPDANEEVVTIWAAGDYVVAETVFTGTNKAAAPGMGIKKATKKPVTLRTAHVLQLEEGKVKQHMIFANGMAMASQLGLDAKPAAKGKAKK
jgi:predicted ester cyclase